MDLAREDLPNSVQPPLETRRSSRERWLMLGLLLLGLCIGLGIGLAIGFGSRLEAVRVAATRVTECEAKRARADATVSSRTALVQPEPVQPPASPISEVALTSEGASSAPLPDASTQPSRKRLAPRPRSTPPQRDVRALGPDLHEALRLLRAAQQALRASDATRALSLLSEMAQKAPDALVDEREVSRALAHCAANDVDSARRTAAALRESGAARVYAHRLSESCVGPEPAPASLLEEMRSRALN